MTPRVAALDIETTARDTDVPVSFDDLSTWTIFAVGLGFRTHDMAEVETEVLIREDGSDRAERKLLARTVNWVRDKEPVDCLTTFNGKEFDMKILENRTNALLKSDRPHEQSLSFALHDALGAPHRDLFAELKEQAPDGEKWPSLNEAIEAHDIEATTPMLDGEPITGANMPDIGRRVLSGSMNARKREALKAYVESDIRPLFELMDALNEEREQRIEAESHAVTQAGESNAGAGR